MQPIPPFPSADEVFAQANNLVGPPAVVIIAVCAVVLVAFRDWRMVLVAFVGLYIGLALLTSTVMEAELALMRVIVGGLVAIMWYLSAQRTGWGGRFLPFSSRRGVQARPLASTTLFRVVLALALAGALLATRLRLPLPPMSPDLELVVTWLAAYSLLGLALGEEALQVGVALLMWLAGTQLALSALGEDLALLGLLSTVELMVGLATAYLMVARGPAEVAISDEEIA